MKIPSSLEVSNEGILCYEAITAPLTINDEQW